MKNVISGANCNRFAIKLYDQDNKRNELVSTAHCLIQSIKDKLPKVLYINNFYIQYKM